MLDAMLKHPQITNLELCFQNKSALNQGCPGNTGVVFPGRYFPVFPALSNTPPGNTGKYFLLQLFYHFSSKS